MYLWSTDMFSTRRRNEFHRKMKEEIKKRSRNMVKRETDKDHFCQFCAPYWQKPSINPRIKTAELSKQSIIMIIICFVYLLICIFFFFKLFILNFFFVKNKSVTSLLSFLSSSYCSKYPLEREFRCIDTNPGRNYFLRI